MREQRRDLGGIFSFTKGFCNDAWMAVTIFVLIVPAFLQLNYQILNFFNVQEDVPWYYGWNFYTFYAALTQQVDGKF